jgi:3-oxoacyl-[acyl-carrier protein] reductase
MSEKQHRLSLAGKVAIVTGGTRGIGKAITACLLQEGVRVAICGTRQETVDEALAGLAAHGEIFGTVADVSKLESVRSFLSLVQQRFGAVHILVNNAGSGIFRSTAELGPEEWDRMLALNLSAVYYCCHEIMPIFRKNEAGGDVINIGSLAGRNPFAGGAGYNASKFGLLGFSEAMMLDHRSEGIRVSCIMPGSVDTGFGRVDTGFGRSDAGFGGSDTGLGGGRPESAHWKIAPEDVAEVVLTVLQMPRRTTLSRVEIRPSIVPGRP